MANICVLEPTITEPYRLKGLLAELDIGDKIKKKAWEKYGLVSPP